jgi:predicted  nucleic acid-binding Zn-ribbon protein
VQKKLSGLKDELTRLQTRASSSENKQNTLLGKVNTGREIQDLSTQKLDALARSQAALYDDLSRTMAEVDSLYFKEFKKYKPQSP